MIDRLSRVIRLAVLAGFGGLIPIMPGWQPTLRAQEAVTPEKVLTDTPDYCSDLARRADLHRDAPPYARELAARGRHMCERGEIVPGIARLRRALLIMRHGSR